MGLGFGNITVANRTVGSVTVDSTELRGEGGTSRPQLIIRTTLQLANRPADSQLAISRVRASLHTDSNASPYSMACAPVEIQTVGNMPIRSFPIGDRTGSPIDLRFLLSYAELVNLETLRHNNQSNGGLTLFLRIEPVVVGIRTSGEVIPNQATEPSPWGIELGLHSEVAVFWSVEVWPVQIQIGRETWVEKVLPGVGFDRLRLMEVLLPPALPDHPSAASEFDAARRALDELRYEDCVGHCRGLISIWERSLESSKSKRIADIVAERLRWEGDDPRRKFLDDLWKSATDLANVPHHPERQVVKRNVDVRDARLFFYLVAGLSEYLGSIPPAST